MTSNQSIKNESFKEESFAELFEQSYPKQRLVPGTILVGKVMEIRPTVVIVNVGLKSEGHIPINQFYNDYGQLEIAVGDKIDVVLNDIEDGSGETLLSCESAKRASTWSSVERVFENGQTIVGNIIEKVKGGFTVNINNIRAFLPGSLVDIRTVRDTSYLEGTLLNFKVIKLDKRRNNVVVSRREVIEQERDEEHLTVLDHLQEGMIVNGVVKNIIDYGAFVDLGNNVTGLIYITDISWERITHPSEVINVGDEVEVKILKFDREKVKIALGIKQLSDDPWTNITRKYQINSVHAGKVISITNYGCFVEIEKGVNGLVYISEMAWTKNINHPSKIVSVGDIIEVMILNIDENLKRISMGIKQCRVNPWNNFQRGDNLVGYVKAITDFGIFVNLDNGIDGLIHFPNSSSEILANKYKKGDEIKVSVLNVDVNHERISLKELPSDRIHN